MWDVIVRAATALLMIGLPLALFLVLRAKAQATWRIIGIGAATFVASQVVHIPLNMFILLPLLKTMGLEMGKTKGVELWFFAILIGLSAGLCEEVARYLVYRHWLSRSERRYKVAVSLGGGHGGCEAILLGIISIMALISYSYLRHEDLNKILPPEQVPNVQKQLEEYWAMPWYTVLMGAVERVTAMTFHISASVLVLQVFLQRNFAYLGAAIGFHSFIDMLAVVASSESWNVLGTEPILAIFTIPLAVWILCVFAPNEQEQTTTVEESALLPPIAEEITEEIEEHGEEQPENQADDGTQGENTVQIIHELV